MKSPCKLNIFLKIISRAQDKHLLASRFIRYEKLFDELYFIPLTQAKSTKSAAKTIKTPCYKDLSLHLKSSTHYPDNILFRVIHTLGLLGFNHKLKPFLDAKALVLIKNIPAQSGLGGASSNAATLLLLLNRLLKLKQKDLFKIGAFLGSDVNFFLSQAKSANVYGFGQIIKPLKNDCIPELELEFIKPCSTPHIFKLFKEQNPKIKKIKSTHLEQNSSKALLKLSPFYLNDLSCVVCKEQAEIKAKLEEGYFLSGAGGAVFRERM